MAEFDINYITAVKGKSVNGLKFANFRYKSSDKQTLDIKAPISFCELSLMEE